MGQGLRWTHVENANNFTYLNFDHRDRSYSLRATKFVSKHLKGPHHELELFSTGTPRILLQHTQVPEKTLEEIQAWAEEIVLTPMDILSEELV